MPIYTHYHLKENQLENIKILKAAGLYDIIYKTDSINENIDWKFIRLQGQKIAQQIAILIKRIVKSGSKIAYQQMKKLVLQCQKYIKENKQPYTKEFIGQALKSLIWGLAFILVEIGDNGFLNNEIFSDCNFHIENGQLVLDDSSIKITVDSTGAPQMNTDSIIQNQFPDVEQKLQSPIHIRQKGQDIPNYHASDEIKRFIANHEGFRDKIYDTKTGQSPKNAKDLKSNKDWTIGYGHKLTKKEKRTWDFNKTISKDEAYKLFLQDFAEHEKSAIQGLKTLPYYKKVIFSQGFVDGLVSIRYNSSSDLTFGNPEWMKQKESFWERLSNCRLDYDQNCLNKQDFEYALQKVKTLYNPQMKNSYGGLPERRACEYSIMRQSFGDINKDLYNK